MRQKSFYVFIFIIIIGFVSCGKKEKKLENNKVISFWHFWSEPNQKNALNELISEFEKINGCKVNTTELSWNDGKTKLFAAFNSNTGPDVLELGSDWVAQFSSSGVLSEINENLIDINKFINFSIEPSFWEGKIYAIPWVVDTRVIFYNKTLLNKVGIDSVAKSFEELLENSKLINELEGYYGFGTNGADKNRLYKKVVTFIWSNGGDIMDKKSSLLNSKENEKAFTMIKYLSKYSIIENQRNLDELFAKGKIGYTISGSWLIRKIREQRNEENHFEFGVIEIPSFNGKKGISFAGGEYLSINNKSENKELSEKLIKYLTDGANTIKFCKKVNEAGFPADNEFYKDNYFNEQKYKGVFSMQLKNAKMTPVHPKWLDIQDVIENLTENIIYNDVEINEELRKSSEKINEILKK